MKFIVKAEGNKYYTGKAGQAFVSSNALDAFAYDSLEAAQRRATNLNQWTTIHSTHFAVSVSTEVR